MLAPCENCKDRNLLFFRLRRAEPGLCLSVTSLFTCPAFGLSPPSPAPDLKINYRLISKSVTAALYRHELCCRTLFEGLDPLQTQLVGIVRSVCLCHSFEMT